MPDQVPPHSENAEQAVLGGILWDNGAFNEVREIIAGRDFYFGKNRLLFECMERILQVGTDLDAIILRDELEKTGNLEKAGGPAYLEQLVGYAMTSANIPHHAKIVSQKSQQREIIMIGQSMASAAMQDREEPSMIIESHRSKIDQLALVGHRGTSSLLDCLPRALSAPTSSIATGFDELDNLCPILPGDLAMLSAQTSFGKTSFAMQIAWQAMWKKQPAGVMIFSSENPDWKVCRRMLSHIQQRSYHTVSQEVEGWVKARMAQIFVDWQTTDVEKMISKCRADHSMGLIHLVIVDLFGHCSTSERTRSENDRLGVMIRKFKALSNTMPVLLLHQLNREAEKDGRPALRHLRDSGHLEQAIQIAWFLDAPEKPQMGNRDPYQVDLIIAKQSTGPRDFSIPFLFRPSTLTFEERQ